MNDWSNICSAPMIETTATKRPAGTRTTAGSIARTRRDARTGRFGATLFDIAGSQAY
jgi:hypothetical protein